MIDDKFLEDLGLGSVPEDEKLKMKHDIQLILSKRIGEKAEQALDDDSFDELDRVASTGNQEEVDKWLSENLPNYKEVVQSELEYVKQEIQPQVEQIVNSFADSNN